MNFSDHFDMQTPPRTGGNCQVFSVQTLMDLLMKNQWQKVQVLYLCVCGVVPYLRNRNRRSDLNVSEKKKKLAKRLVNVGIQRSSVIFNR